MRHIAITVPKTSPDEVWGKNVPATLVGQHLKFEGEDVVIKTAHLDQFLDLIVSFEVSDETLAGFELGGGIFSLVQDGE